MRPQNGIRSYDDGTIGSRRTSWRVGDDEIKPLVFHRRGRHYKQIIPRVRGKRTAGGKTVRRRTKT